MVFEPFQRGSRVSLLSHGDQGGLEIGADDQPGRSEGHGEWYHRAALV